MTLKHGSAAPNAAQRGKVATIAGPDMTMTGLVICFPRLPLVWHSCDPCVRAGKCRPERYRVHCRFVAEEESEQETRETDKQLSKAREASARYESKTVSFILIIECGEQAGRAMRTKASSQLLLRRSRSSHPPMLRISRRYLSDILRVISSNDSVVFAEGLNNDSPRSSWWKVKS